MSNSLPAEVFAPGEFIREELEVRGWSQEDLAEILGRPVKTINGIINGKKQITPQTAIELSEAFGTSAEVWLNLESAYRISLAEKGEDLVAKRSKIYSLVPVKELCKREWISCDPRGDVSVLENKVCDFLSIKTLDDSPTIRFAARVSWGGAASHPGRVAWISRVRNLASGMHVESYCPSRLRSALPELPKYSVDPDNAAKIPMVLGALGVRTVFVPHLPRTRIDGAALWLDKRSPVIALSIRHGRIDCFWFTLMHELAHIISGDPDSEDIVDNQLVGKDRKSAENRKGAEAKVDRLTADWLIDRTELAEFVRRTAPRFSRKGVEALAEKLGIHPGIVVGRLQYDGHIPWTHLRNVLVNVRESIESGGVFDAVPRSLVGAG